MIRFQPGISKLEDHILARPGLSGCSLRGANIVGCKEDHGKADIGVGLEFFEDCSPTVGLLEKNDGLKLEPLQKSRRCFSGFRIMATHNENVARILERFSKDIPSNGCVSLAYHVLGEITLKRHEQLPDHVMEVRRDLGAASGY